MKYKFERDNHIHLLEGFYDPNTHDIYNITQIILTINSSPNIITQIPIGTERLRIILKKYIEKDLALGKYDDRIKYPVDFNPDNFNNYLIEIEHNVTNEHKQLYKLKQFYYENIKDMQKMNKYQHKLETPAYRDNSIQVFTGGAQTPLIKDIPDNICDGIPKQKPKDVIEIYSEPLTRAIFEILETVCWTELKLQIKPKEFVYVKNESSTRLYYSQCTGNINFNDFENKYNNLFNKIDRSAKLDGVDSFFDDEYTNHFKKDTFENNTWKSRIMANHLVSHKYAHNGIGRNEFSDFVDMISILDLNTESNIFIGLQFVHSLAHVYDDIYMRPVNHHSNIVTLDEVKNNMFGQNIRQYDCLRKIINKHRFDFLVKTGNNFNQPYQIKPEAIEDKKRQYTSRGLFSKPLHPDFDSQINADSYAKIGEIDKMIHEDFI